MGTEHEQLVMRGNSSCAGCAAVLILRQVAEAVGPNQIMVIPACCMGAVAGRFPTAAFNVPVLRTAFACAGAFLSGLDASLRAKGEHTTLVGFAGDGATVDIGLASLSGAIERGHDFVYVCYDNEGYMNTGFQRSGSTPPGAKTSTTPGRLPATLQGGGAEGHREDRCRARNPVPGDRESGLSERSEAEGGASRRDRGSGVPARNQPLPSWLGIPVIAIGRIGPGCGGDGTVEAL